MIFSASKFLEDHGLRITRPRTTIASILFADGKNRHVTAEWMAEELDRRGEPVALATVYNTLHCFVQAGALRDIRGAEPGLIIFDTNTDTHHHFYDETNGQLTDIPSSNLTIDGLPDVPKGKTVSGCDLIIRIR